MSIWETDKLIIFIAFVIPGFISLKVYSIFIANTNRDTSKQVIDAVAYSCINYAICFPLLMATMNEKFLQSHEYWFLLSSLYMILINPILLSLIWLKVRKSKIIKGNSLHPVGKPWDYVFSQEQPYWVKVTLKNGEVLGGKYSDKSFASSAPNEEQIYLEETWILSETGKFERAKNGTAGIIILASEISHVELRKG
ncbi:hypothetical protein CGH28_18460 [Vibrio parahaemolyticus]|nr:hypothetical protein [Vibrio parahaemolyticus]TOO77992.1 hypothetical protein CGH28_18460 [Vibrio parahaemolyticus]HCH3750668.1 hypothetical protein [Vibrio parahaemolyticus]HCH4148690.1 hypothetical protein [Vibrio parahaemolyticus]